MTSEERVHLRHEITELYLAIARDLAQPAMLRMQDARHLLERIDNPFPNVDGNGCASATGTNSD